MIKSWKALKGPDMKPGELRISGGSDDLTEIEGWLQEEFSADTPIRIGGVLIVTMKFDGVVGWQAVVCQSEESQKVPWPVTIEFHDDSPVVVVGCPVGTPLEIMRGVDDD